MPALPRLLASTLVLALLAACSAPKLTEFAPVCPRVAVVADAADLTVYRPGGGEDLTDLVLDGRIASFKGGCERADVDHVRTTLSVSMLVQRGPAGPRANQLEYFVAVRDGERIVDKEVYAVTFEFPANQDWFRGRGPDASILVPVSREKGAAAYDVLIGFQLTPEQLALNRRRGRR